MSDDTSATGGFLVPNAPLPVEGDSLTNLLQATLVGLTGIPATLVRPRWQQTPPTQPEITVDWISLGVTERLPMDFPYLSHDGTENGTSTLSRQELLTVMCSFYGPNANENASQVRDGIYLNQNMEALNASGIRFYDAGEITSVPENANFQWLGRSDVSVRFVRQIDRTYPILNILSASGTFTTGSNSEPWAVNQP